VTYITLFLSTLVASFGNILKGFPSRTVFYVSCFFVFIVVGFRYASTDYFSYLSIYESIEGYARLGFFIYDVNERTPIESGFALLVLLEKFFVGSFYFFISIFAFISLLIQFSAFYRLSPYFILSLLIYLSDEYFWKDLGQMRNAMASGVVLWAFYYAYCRRIVPFIFLVFIAVLFHVAAVVALPFYFVNWFKERIFLVFFLLVTLLIVGLYGGLGLLLVEISQFLGVESSSRLVKYASTKYVEGSAAFGGTFLLQLLVCLSLLIFYRKLVDKWPLNDFLIPVYIYGSCLFFFIY
jgi:hypothetical protein